MREALAFVFVLIAGGCSAAGWHTFFANYNPDTRFGSDSDDDATPAPPIVLSDAKCRELAFDRTLDVADQGFDESVRRAVFASTYADCVAWDARGMTVAAR